MSRWPDDARQRLEAAAFELFGEQGYDATTVTQIAERLVRSKKTVSTHKRRAMRKLQLSDDLSLALYLRDKFAE